MRTFAHIVNPVRVQESSDLFIAQPVTFESMKAARAYAASVVDVMLLSAQYPDDHGIVPEEFRATRDLNRSVMDIKGFDAPRNLPLIKDVLDRLYEASSPAEYLIYTNSDIALTPMFYVAVNALIEQGFDALVINRRTISSDYTSTEDLPLMYMQFGQSHPGYDCFVFQRKVYPEYELGDICIGASGIGMAMFANLFCCAERFDILKKVHLTFHIGEDQPWKRTEYDGYSAHNAVEFEKVLKHLERGWPSKVQELRSLFEHRRSGLDWVRRVWQYLRKKIKGLRGRT